MRLGAGGERGQAAVELAVVLPLVVVLLGVFVQVVQLGVDRVVVVLAAREGARAAAAGAPADEAERRARGAAGDGEVAVSVAFEPGAGTVTVRVGLTRRPGVPLAAALLPDAVEVSAQVTMQVEA